MGKVRAAAIVLAAGQGTRMKSDLPKVLHPCCERPIVKWILRAVEEAGAEQTVVVVGHGADEVKASLGDGYVYAEQTERLGTAHAALMAEPFLNDFDGPVLVLAGDTPLLQASTLEALLARQTETGAPCVMTTCRLDDPTGYGRIVRDLQGQVMGIVEHKDASDEQRKTNEVNPAIYCFDGKTLFDLLPQVKNDNAQGEYYLPDLIKMIYARGATIETVESDDPDEFRGVNDRWQLAEAAKVLKGRILRRHAESGVTILDIETTVIGPDVEIGADAVVKPFTTLEGRTTIGATTTVGPNSYVRDARIGEGATVWMSHVNEAEIGDGTKVGPFANVRPGSVLGPGVKVGNFVEVKNTELAADVSVSHLTYLGDATVGEGTNIGAGTITCNYDGFRKSRTVIGADCFIGSHSTLVAPLTVGDESMVAAGSVVTEDVPDGALAIGRSRQSTKEGWFRAWRKKQTEQ